MPRTLKKMLSETDLYAPLAVYLRAQGYTVHSEVAHCDLTAVKGDELVVVELKRNASLSLLIQATKRQRLTDSVYVALPKPKRGRTWLGVQHVLRRLEIGLITVSFETKEPAVEIVFHPLPFRHQKQRRRTRAVLQEIANRSGDYNQGGSTRRKLMTAYRENALQVACCLERFGTLTPKQLRGFGTGAKTYSILHRNVYHWFERVGPAQYALRNAGAEELAQYPEVVKRCRKWATGLEPPEEAPAPARARLAPKKVKQEKAEAAAKQPRCLTAREMSIGIET
jgi:hypothetical protein